MNFIIGQVISIVVLIISVIVVQFKNIKYILIGEIIMNLLVALSFVFLGGLSGAWICIVATVQTLIMYLVNRREIASWKRTALMVVFVAAYIIGTVIVYQGWSDIVSCVCAMLYVLAVVQKDASKYRIFIAINSFLWVIYDLDTAAYVNVVTHGMTFISTVSAMIRLDRRKKQ